MTEKCNGHSQTTRLGRRSYLLAATGTVSAAALGVTGSAAEDDEPNELPEVEAFFETFDGDLSAFGGDVDAFEIATGGGGN